MECKYEAKTSLFFVPWGGNLGKGALSLIEVLSRNEGTD